jgi:hypothetical protein
MSSVEDDLREFLEDQKADKAAGVTLQAVYRATRTLANQQSTHELKCDARWERNREHQESTNGRLVTVEAKIENLAKQEEITGTHNLAAIAMAAEAKGLASRPQINTKDSLPPLARGITHLTLRIGEKWGTHVALMIVGALVTWIAHVIRWLP